MVKDKANQYLGATISPRQERRVKAASLAAIKGRAKKLKVGGKAFDKVLSSKGDYSKRFGATGETDDCYGTMCGTFDAAKFVDGREEKKEVMMNLQKEMKVLRRQNLC